MNKEYGVVLYLLFNFRNYHNLLTINICSFRPIGRYFHNPAQTQRSEVQGK
jgi:hypothetical protein